jgi:hypothetical protein
MSRNNSPSREEREVALDQLAHVKERGIQWLLAHIDESGQPADSEQRNGWYRLPWTLAHVGLRDEAELVLSWAERQALTLEGDLREGGPRDQFVAKCCTYPLTILAQGAWLLERYDTALAIMNNVRTLMNWNTGGAYWERPEHRSTGRQLIYPTAQVGLAALMTGQHDLADATFGWFDRLWSAQPSLPDRLYPAWGPEGLVTNVEPADQFHCIVEFAQPRQAFYNPGISASFLSRYFMATGIERARAMALAILRLHDGATPEQYNYHESMQICKFGWGTAVIHEIDDDDRHVRNLVRMARWYNDSQRADGNWVPSGFLEPDPHISDAMAKTAEHTLWVSIMHSSLAGGQPRRL